LNNRITVFGIRMHGGVGGESSGFFLFLFWLRRKT
jgi:hypothetical protein